MLSLIFLFLITFASSLLLTPAARAAARRLGVVDRPDGKRKLQKQPVALWGGVAVYISLLVGLMVATWMADTQSSNLASLAWVLAGVAGFVCFFGALDDTLELNSRCKLLLQIVSTLPVVLAGFYVEKISVFGQPIELGWLGVPLTMFWLVGCMNAVNLLDGMDGLASVVGVSSAVMIALIAATSGSPHVALLAIALAGALCGFLAFNLPPASIYLGDSGSLLIGLVIGVLAFQGSMKASATLSITIPAVVMTIPMLDSVLAIVRRRFSGLRFDVADRGHIHHRLLDRGLSKWQALGVIGALCLTTGAAAAAATVIRNDALAWLVAVTMVVTLVRVRAFGHHELALVKLSIGSLLSRFVHQLIETARPSDHLSSAKLATMPFEEVWDALTAEVHKWKGRELELAAGVNRKNPEYQTTWTNGKQHDGQENGWSYAMVFSGPDQQFCRLRIVADEAGVPQPWPLLQLTRVLKICGEFWAANPEACAAATLRFDQSREKPAGKRYPAAFDAREAA